MIARRWKHAVDGKIIRIRRRTAVAEEDNFAARTKGARESRALRCLSAPTVHVRLARASLESSCTFMLIEAATCDTKSEVCCFFLTEKWV